MKRENKKRKKIVLIGAGSAMFAKGLIADLIRRSEIGPWELALVDIDPEALRAIDGVAQKMITAKQADIIISSTTDRKEVLSDADVVVTMIGVGGRRAWEQDVFIPRKYGVYQPVGDTAMAGGISRALRMIPAMVDIARDIEEICPQALFFNYANPMTAICRAVNKATNVEMTGLCVGVNETISYLANVAGVPVEDVSGLWAGVNHFTFIYEFRYQGQDLWPAIRNKLANLKETNAEVIPGQEFREMGSDKEQKSKIAEHPFSWNIFETYGAFPAVLDRHVVEFFPERFLDGQYHGHTLGVDTFSVEKTIDYGDQIYEEIVAEGIKEGPLSPDFFEKSEGEHDQLLDILDAIYGDRKEVFSVNQPNEGTVQSLPSGAILETPGITTANGFTTMKLDVPDHMAAIINKKLGSIELTVEAALKGDYRLFVEALLADGCINDKNKAAQMAEELLKAQEEYLPQF